MKRLVFSKSTPNRLTKIIFVALVSVVANLTLAESRTPISSPIQITASGSYFLTKNIIIGELQTDAIEVKTSDVSIDLNGFTIKYEGTKAPEKIGIVVIGGNNNIEIRNGTIKGFFIGIRFNKPDESFYRKDADIRISNMRIMENKVGVAISPNGFVMENSTFSGNISSIDTEGGGMINNNIITNSQRAILLGPSYSGTNPKTSYYGNMFFNISQEYVSGDGLNLGRNVCGHTLCP